VATGLGVCGLDPRRTALNGGEIRPCWTAPALVTAGGSPDVAPAASLAMPERVRRPARTFVPVEDLVAPAGARPDAPEPLPAAQPQAAPAPGWSLWAELEV
jgi:hypothetical protein